MPQTSKPVKESGLSASCRCFLSERRVARFDVAVDQQVRAWHQKHRHDTRNRETSQNGSCQRGGLLTACLKCESHGDQAKHSSERGHQDGTQTHFAGSDDGFLKLESLLAKLAGELNDQYAVRNHNASHHQHAHEAHDVQRSMRGQQEEDHTGDSGRNGQQDDEGVDERGELRHQDQENEHDGENEADSERLERVEHVVDRAANRQNRSMRGMGVVDYLTDLLADAVQVFRLGHHVDVEHAAKLVVIYLSRRIDGFDGGDRFEWSCILAVRGSKRDFLEVVQGLNLRLRVLDGQQVIVSGLRVDPVARIDPAVRRHGRDHVIDNVLGRQTFEAGLLTVDVEGKTGVIDVLRNQDIADAVHFPKSLGELLGY